MVWRRTFPGMQALEAVAQVIADCLPDTARAL